MVVCVLLSSATTERRRPTSNTSLRLQVQLVSWPATPGRQLTSCGLGARSEDEAYSCHVQRFRRDVGIAVAREFARYRLLRVPFIGVPRAVVRDRRREVRAVPAEGPMQADFFRHQADIWQEAAG